MRPLKLATASTTAAALAFALVAPGANASTTTAAETQPVPTTNTADLEEELDLGISNEDFIAAVEYAEGVVDDPVADPDGFEAAIDDYIQNELGIDTDAEDDDSSEANPQALPVAVVIAGRIGACFASSYTILNSIDPNASNFDQAAAIGAAVSGCVGVAGPQIRNWILNNPQAARTALTAVGLGFLLEGDSANTASAQSTPASVSTRDLVVTA